MYNLKKTDLTTGTPKEAGAPYSSETKVVAEPASFYGIRAGESQQKWVEVLVNCPKNPYNKSPQNSAEIADEDSEEINEAEQQSDEELQLYTYSIPAGLEVQPGNIVIVPFGSQQLSGIVINFTSQIPANLTPDKIREIKEVIAEKFLSPAYLQLLQQVANYYCTPLIKVIRATMPPGLLPKSQERIRLAKNIPADVSLFLRSKSAQDILKLLQASPSKNLSKKRIKSLIKGAEYGLQDLLKRGLVETYQESAKPIKAKRQLAVTLINDAFTTDLTAKQREVLNFLRRAGGEMWLTELLTESNVTKLVVNNLVEKGCVDINEQEKLRAPALPTQTPDQPKTLTPHQKQALDVIKNLTGYAKILLHGVTGSGKTEIYLQTIAPILESGKSAIVLVPEIGLTPQLTDRFRARFGDKVFVYHSALGAGERYDTWRQMLQEEAKIIIGTRSAIFSPLPNLGVIILDEEYDSSFKQDQPAPTYHARTVAKWRAELTNCPLILGSATPSIETWLEIAPQNSQPSPTPSPNTYYLSLPQRVHARPLPPISIIDMREQLRDGNRSIFSRPLQDAFRQLQTTKQQGILFIHRRGHSTFVSCRSCGYVIECPNCDVSLSYHFGAETETSSLSTFNGFLRCHFCGYNSLQPQRCPECESPYFKHFGTGTQRIEQELAKQFPQLRVIRFDSDTTRTKDAHRQILTRFSNGEADLLIGTQMLTKGLDLPQVTLVGVIAADGLLNLPDYRASERAFQTLTQVAGRAGRGNDPGKVIIQTYTPEHPVIEAVQRHDYTGFIQTELKERAALGYPPYGRLVLLRLSGVSETDTEQTAGRLAELLQTTLDSAINCEILGPAPAPVMRVANRYRWHILLKYPPQAGNYFSNFSQLRSLCRAASVSLTIDIDPLNLG
ncbi:primosomal protein N' [Ancylothrix sp. C2]|uniref:primosomal protein N' n=1 Tax=Ancylothrix sp. D3o TaxID=2953691 RepID=UPI0021BA49D2|nr:primosomal protein N' [Ancylothrix sp. D3o]MCT7948952.1 primosomal protein N' [Ancylothrix sp. D3o]